MSWRGWAGISAIAAGTGLYLAFAAGGGWYPFAKLQALQTPSPAHLALPPPPTPVPPTPVPTVRQFEAQLDGEQEVPPRSTDASGQAIFTLKNETQLDFSLNLLTVKNFIEAHIHCAPEGENGAVGVTLYGPVSPGGGTADVSIQGAITAPDAENECGWADLAAMLEAMRNGNAYVNVHTDDGVDPPDTGPGDFSTGEMRGQIKRIGS